MHCPSPATVGASNSAATGKSMPNAARVRAIAWVANLLADLTAPLIDPRLRAR